MKIRPDQVEMFQKQSLARFEMRTLARLRHDLSRLTEGRSDEELAEAIRSGREKAMFHGLQSDREITLFVMAHLLLGTRLEAALAGGWARKILDDVKMTSWRKAERLLEMARTKYSELMEGELTSR